MGGDKRCGDLEWKQPTMPASFFFFFSSPPPPPPPPPRPAAVITQPNPLGGLSRLKSRKIVQLSGLRAGEGGGVVGTRERERWDCVLLGHVVFIRHSSLSQGYFEHEGLADQKKSN